VVIEHVKTELIIVDPLTKGMPLFKFKENVMNMGLVILMNFLIIVMFSSYLCAP
jgi:hypothetical protein